MIEYFKKKRERKKHVVEQVKQDKIKRKERKLEIANMSESDKKSAKLYDRKTNKNKRSERKEELKTLNWKERSVKRKEYKLYRKIKNRPRRFAVWGIFGVLVLFVTIQVGPIAMSLIEVISGKHINMNTESAVAVSARENAEHLSEEIANEGIVLLSNEDDHLPLQDEKVNVFGLNALAFRYGGGGSGSADISRAVSLYEGLTNAGIDYNEELYDLYTEIGEEYGIGGNQSTGLAQVVQGMLSSGNEGDNNIDYLSTDVLQQAKNFSDNALIVIASEGVEASDMSSEQLQLPEGKRALIEKVSEYFNNVTIVVNSGNAMELGFVEEYDSIKSVVWVGTPGPYGANALGSVLAGNVNPSGRLTDTYVYDNKSAPASENFGDYSYDNLDFSFINYQEGIYVGYRYYETFFIDNDEGYDNTVLYPYGYGLSYTDFEWEILEQNFTDETIELDIQVTNIGDMEGKDVVQVYYSAPYVQGGIEKSAIEMAAFEKTSLLEPGESETLTLSYETSNMASYDKIEEEAYVMDSGVYDIHIARNVRDILETYEYNVEDKIVFKEDPDTGTPYENQFELAEGELTYLSRQNWEETYPNDKNISHTAPDYVVESFTNEREVSDLEMPEFGQENGIMLADLKGLDYEDPLWSDFLDQLTLEEMFSYVTEGAYKTNAIERLGVKQSLLMDGPAGFSYFFQPVTAAAYPSEIVVASTWNKDLAYEMGKAVGEEASAYGIQGWYAPGMNIHRTAQGGRNFEYFSEDPVLTGKIGSSMIKGAQDQGVIVFMKHFALNDQETNARSGNMVWADEQAIREIYLKPFEISVKEADVLGVMSSFSIIGTEWAGANSTLLNTILREEWGFNGFVSSDAVFGFMEAPDAVMGGNDLMLDTMTPAKNYRLLEEAYEEDPSGIANAVRKSTQNIMYTLLKTNLYD